MKRWALRAVWLCLLLGCKRDSPQKQLDSAFYYWKSVFRLSVAEKQTLRQLSVQKLYVKFFDVDWQASQRKPVPKAVIWFAEPPPCPIVPVVFITNRTIAGCSPQQVGTLAEQLVGLIEQIANQQTLAINEIQLDCDWTVSTRQQYFTLLERIRTLRASTPLTCTIRLHQIKYASLTGVPPVSRGMLMFYNVADWRSIRTRNSIYDLDVAQRYLGNLSEYPLPLDVVLPVFRWTVVYRNGRFKAFLNHLSQNELAQSAFLKPSVAYPACSEVRQDTLCWGLSLRRGDVLRPEAVPFTQLQAGKLQLLEKIRNQKLTFALYHLDASSLLLYENTSLATLLEITQPLRHPQP